MSALSIRDIATNLNISYNTAKKMVVDLMDLGTSNIVKYKNTLRVLNMEMFLMELNKKNKIQEEIKCQQTEQQTRHLLKKIGKREFTMPILPLMVADTDILLKQAQSWKL